ncbi:MAG: hypothetical protein ACKVU0_18315 [Saprospiraceae bacterium]
MDESKFVELVKILRPAEKEQVLHFAMLPFFNHGGMSAQVVQLLEFCLNYPWGSGQSMSKKEVYSAIFPGQEFIEGKLEKVMVMAHKVIQSFLLTQHYFREENEFYQIYDLAELVRTRGLEARHQQLLIRLQKNQEESKHKNFEHYLKQIHLEYAKHYAESLKNQKKGDLNIPNLLESIEAFYHIRRVALLNRYLLQQKVTTLDVPEIIHENLANWVVPERYLGASPSLLINYVVLTALKKGQPELADVESLFNLLQVHEKNLDWENLQEFYAYLRNFCVLILMVDQDNMEVMLLLHETNKDNLERGFLHYEGKLVPSRYKSISATALNVKQFDWANEFIERYKHEIYGENETQDIYRHNKALYLFAVGKFSECLDFIPSTSPFIDYLMQGKRLELKAFYELRSELLTYKLDAFKMFLSRTSPKLLSASLRKSNQEFANLLHQLTYSAPGDASRPERLVKRIEEKKQAAEWSWLLAKARLLK